MKKTCCRCRRSLLPYAFHRDRTKKDGRHSYCKKCVNGMKRLLYIAVKKWPYTKGDVLKDKDYLRDRTALFMYNGNGWWWFTAKSLGGSYPLNKEFWREDQ